MNFNAQHKTIEQSLVDINTEDKIVEQSQVDFNAQNKYGSTALLFACFNGNLEVVKYLIETVKVNILKLDFRSQTILHAAVCGKNSYEVTNYLIQKSQDFGLDLNHRNRSGKSAFYIACILCYDVQIVKLFLDNAKSKNIDVLATNNHGDTILHKACSYFEGIKKDQGKIIKLILEYSNKIGLDIHQKNGQNLSALQIVKINIKYAKQQLESEDEESDYNFWKNVKRFFNDFVMSNMSNKKEVLIY